MSVGLTIKTIMNQIARIITLIFRRLTMIWFFTSLVLTRFVLRSLSRGSRMRLASIRSRCLMMYISGDARRLHQGIRNVPA